MMKGILFALLFGFLTNQLTAADPIKIGVPSALSGNAASYGTDIRNGIYFANEKLGQGRYELIADDDQCTDRQAVSVANKLAGIDKVRYVLGVGCSGSVLASAPVYDKAKVVVIASGGGAPAITNAGDYIFRTKPSLVMAAQILAKDVAKKFKKVGVITEETAYAQGLAEAFGREAENAGVAVIKDNFPPNTDDFLSLFLRLKSAGVEAVFLNSQAESTLVSMYRQFQGLHWKVQVYGSFLPGSPAFLKAFGKSADGVLFTDLAFNDDYLNDKGLSIIRDYEKEYGKPQSSEHFVTLSILAFSALDEAIRSGKDVKEYLYSHTFRDLVDGGFSFDKNGDVVSDKVTYVMKVLRNGAPARP